MEHTGTVYLLHFDEPYHHAKHYLGFCERGKLQERIDRHAAGYGARLLEVVIDNGIGFRVARVWHRKTRGFERMLKNRKEAPRFCPICTDRPKNPKG